MSEITKRIKKMALDPSLQVTVRVGKSGLTETLINELNSQLSSKKLVKAKVNRGLAEDSADRKNLWDKLAEETNSTLVVMRGNVAVFHR